MKPRDYKCQKCGEIREIWIHDEAEFPDFIPCYKCGDDAKKTFSKLHGIVYQGSVGNYNNGYTNTGGYIKKTK